MHPATEHVLQYFEYGHLPPHLVVVSQPFSDLANRLAVDLDGHGLLAEPEFFDELPDGAGAGLADFAVECELHIAC